MNSNKLNICTVTLGTDAMIVNENLIEFNKLYQNVKLYIVCPKKDVDIFKNSLTTKNYEILTEDEFIEFKDFKNIFEELSIDLQYKDKFKNRLQWYYALFLKFFFIHKFLKMMVLKLLFGKVIQ